jgi:hypothetical protein
MNRPYNYLSKHRPQEFDGPSGVHHPADAGPGEGLGRLLQGLLSPPNLLDQRLDQVEGNQAVPRPAMSVFLWGTMGSLNSARRILGQGRSSLIKAPSWQTPERAQTPHSTQASDSMVTFFSLTSIAPTGQKGKQSAQVWHFS